MRRVNHLSVLLGLAFMLACGLPGAPSPAAPAMATVTVAAATLTSAPPAAATLLPFTPIPSSASAAAPLPPPSDFCSDAAVSALLQSFKSAVLSSNGASFAALVSPARGLDVRFFRYVDPVNYDQEHAEFVFESAFVINWGPQPGSGEDLKGPFHEVIVPSLEAVFEAASTTYVCNQIKTGGATYLPEWPYPNVAYYSIFFPGTEAYGGLDWQTWLTGIHFVQGQPYLHALIHMDWEP
jgi:hypothetical protein